MLIAPYQREAHPPTTDNLFGTKYTILDRDTETTDNLFGAKYTILDRDAETTDNLFGTKYTILDREAKSENVDTVFGIKYIPII